MGPRCRRSGAGNADLPTAFPAHGKDTVTHRVPYRSVAVGRRVTAVTTAEDGLFVAFKDEQAVGQSRPVAPLTGPRQVWASRALGGIRYLNQSPLPCPLFCIWVTKYGGKVSARVC